MKKTLATLVILLVPTVSYAGWFGLTWGSEAKPETQGLTFGADLRVLTVPQGGTGAGTWPVGECLKGNGTSALTSGDCGSGSSFAYPFTVLSNYNASAQATTGIPWFQNGLNASSTSHFVHASTTSLSGDSLCIGTDCRTSWPVDTTASSTLLSDNNTWTGTHTFVYPSVLRTENIYVSNAGGLSFADATYQGGYLDLYLAATPVVGELIVYNGTNEMKWDFTKIGAVRQSFPAWGGEYLVSTSTTYVSSIYATTTTASVLPYASTTAISSVTSTTTDLFGANLVDCDDPTASKLLWSDTGKFSCGSDQSAAGDGAFAWTPTTNYNTAVNATNTPIWFQAGLHASSTSQLTYASTTAVSADNFYGALTGNASTATSLAADGTDCSAGSAPIGVDASGNVQSCFDVWTEAENTSAGYGTGSVTSVATNNGLTGGTITTTGTIGLDLSAVGAVGMPLTLNGSNQLTATGTVSLSAPYFIATSSSNTNTFAGTTTVPALQVGSTAIGSNVLKISPRTGLTASNSESVGGLINCNTGTTDSPCLVLYRNTSGSTRNLSIVDDDPTFSGNSFHIRNDGTNSALNAICTGLSGKGCYKVAVWNGVDADSSAISFQIDDDDAQGIFGLAGPNYNGYLMQLRVSSTSPAFNVNVTADDPKVGIGTSTPYSKLSVVGQVVAANYVATTTTASTFPYASTTALTSTGAVAFSTDGSTSFGYGTTTPGWDVAWTETGSASDPFDFNLFNQGSQAGQQVRINLGGYQGRIKNAIVDTLNAGGATSDLSFMTGNNASTEVFRIAGATVNVGIGTTTPYAKLSVVGPVVAEYFHATSTTATTTLSGGVSIGTSVGTTTPYIRSTVSGFGGGFIIENEGGGTCTLVTFYSPATPRYTDVTCPAE